MDITKIYTKTMHKALQNSLKKGFRLEYKPSGNFIKYIWSTKHTVTFAFNTVICCRSVIDKEKFLNYDYSSIIKDLQKCYNKTQVNDLYQLRNEFYQPRYVLNI